MPIIMFTASYSFCYEEMGNSYYVAYTTKACSVKCSSGSWSAVYMFESSATFVQTAGTYASTKTINLNSTSTNTPYLFVSSATGLPYWTAELAEGCYAFQPSTTTTTDRMDNEGYSEGFAYDGNTGKQYTNCSDTSTTVYLYLQGTTGQAKYFTSVPWGRHALIQSEISTMTISSTQYMKEGNTLASFGTTLDTSIKGLTNYPESCPLTGTNVNKTFGYEVIYGSWVTSGASFRLHKKIVP